MGGEYDTTSPPGVQGKASEGRAAFPGRRQTIGMVGNGDAHDGNRLRVRNGVSHFHDAAERGLLTHDETAGLPPVDLPPNPHSHQKVHGLAAPSYTDGMALPDEVRLRAFLEQAQFHCWRGTAGLAALRGFPERNFRRRRAFQIGGQQSPTREGATGFRPLADLLPPGGASSQREGREGFSGQRQRTERQTGLVLLAEAREHELLKERTTKAWVGFHIV